MSNGSRRPESPDAAHGPTSVVVAPALGHLPCDETYDKLASYADLGVGGVIVAPPGRAGGDAVPACVGDDNVLVQAGAEGRVRSAALGTPFATVADPRLAIGWEGGSAET